jgi:hypothetical protein
MTGFLAIIAGALLEMLQLAPVPAAGGPEPQDPDRPRLSLRDFKGLRENNVFAPAKTVRVTPPRHEGRKETTSAPPPAAPAKPRTPVVTGFVFDHASQAFTVLVEDRNSDVKLKLFTQPRFLKAGEEFLGYVIESVDRETVSVKAGETVKLLRAGESFPEGVGPAPARTEAPSPAPPGEKAAGAAEPARAEPAKVEAPADDAARRKVLEELRSKFKKKRDESDFEQP